MMVSCRPANLAVESHPSIVGKWSVALKLRPPIVAGEWWWCMSFVQDDAAATTGMSDTSSPRAKNGGECKYIYIMI